jgi:Kdo2-lipid IVA lauroyltransferase/acyltransferase
LDKNNSNQPASSSDADSPHSRPQFSASYFLPTYWPTWLALALFYLIARLPYKANILLGRAIGFLFLHLAGSRRRITQVNIVKCFPELDTAAQQQLVKGVLMSCGISLMESAMALWGPAAKFRKRHSIAGLEYLAEAKAAGKGVLLVGCHFTTLDAAARILAFYSAYDMLYRKDPNPLLAYKLISAREAFAGSAIVRSDTRQLIKNLRQGNVVWYAPDQDYGIKHSVFAPFFGVSAATVTATAKVAQLGRAVVLPFAHYRDQQGGYKLEIGAPLVGYPSGDDLADASRINAIFEASIRRQPDQYLWVHRRFKTRPAGEASFYAKKKP